MGARPRPSAWADRTSPTGSLRGGSISGRHVARGSSAFVRVRPRSSAFGTACGTAFGTAVGTAFGTAVGHRPPSPARAAVPNTITVVAGEGRGWGNNKLPSLCWHVTAINHSPPNFGGLPQLGVRRVRRLLMRSEPAVDRNGHAPALMRCPQGARVVPFDRFWERRAKRRSRIVQVREPAPVDRSRGCRRMGRRRTRRTPSSVVRVREPAPADRSRGFPRMGGVGLSP